MILESSCTTFDENYIQAFDYVGVVEKRVHINMQSRINTYKAGKIIEAHLKHLLGSADFDENMAVTGTSRYELSSPPIPPKGPCSLTALTASHWDLPISCGTACMAVQVGQGANHVNTKVVTLPHEGMHCESNPINEQGLSNGVAWRDVFRVNVQGSQLTVHRVDITYPLGWGQHLELECCLQAEA